MIAKITRAYIRRYSDNRQVAAYVEWTDTRGKTGRTEGPATRAGCTCRSCGQLVPDTWHGLHVGDHMRALFHRAERDGLTVEREGW